MQASYSYGGAKNYLLLTKPGIILGNLITTFAGFALASKGHINFLLFLITGLGIGLIIASACVFNNYIDRNHDKKMGRTKNRGLATGAVSIAGALTFAIFLGIAGAAVMFYFVNLTALFTAYFGFFAYVILYSYSKYHTVHGTLIGSISGAVPPVVGYVAASNQVDAGALIFFVMIVLWQMPHFFAIAIYRMEDYSKAGIPVLPVMKGIQRAKIQMSVYIVLFTACASLLTIYGYTNAVFLAIAVLSGLSWLGICLQGFKASSDKIWARKMFVVSLVVVMALSIAIPFCVT